MDGVRSDTKFDQVDVGHVLENAADLMATFHSNDVALQNALSEVTRKTDAPVAMRELQHIDLITQVHADLARLLPVLAKCLHGDVVTTEDLRSSLTLRSLQEALLEPSGEEEPPSAGELSLF